MNKLKMKTNSLVDKNVDKIATLFPNCVTENIKEYDNSGKPIYQKVVDFDLLRQELSSTLVEGKDERYRLDWSGKRQAILTANSPIAKTLRPVVEDEKESTGADSLGNPYLSSGSVGKDGTAGKFDSENLYIEGDNLDVLKLLSETYLNKIKMIYIDPPYNTGMNLIYINDFAEDVEGYLYSSNQKDEFGNRMTTNKDTSGRYHSDWLSMMYMRLKIARDLLSEDGIIIIAIDDNEVYNLKRICDEVIGESNFVGTIVTRCNPQGRGKYNIDPVHEYHLVFARDINKMPLLKVKKEEFAKSYGPFMRSGTNSRKYERPLRFYPLLEKHGSIFTIEEYEYKKIYNTETMLFDEKYILELKNKYESQDYTFILPIARNGEEKVWQRTYDRAKKECTSYIFENGTVKVPLDNERTPTSLWNEDIHSNVAYGTNKLKELFNNDTTPFDYSKSIFTVKELLTMNDDPEAIVLDFFSGSSTTAHAVMLLNAEDGGNRKFIMVQVPEVIGEKAEAYRLGFKVIPEIAKERIIKAGNKIIEDSIGNTLDNLDIGFRVLKLDSSNMKDTYYNPDQYSQEMLFGLESSVKDDRSAEDLLFQIMLDKGVLLSSKIEKRTTVQGSQTYYIVGETGFDIIDLICCLDKKIDTDAIVEIAKLQPECCVFLDSGMESDATRTNVEQIFATYSSKTKVEVI